MCVWWMMFWCLCAKVDDAELGEKEKEINKMPKNKWEIDNLHTKYSNPKKKKLSLLLLLPLLYLSYTVVHFI